MTTHTQSSPRPASVLILTLTLLSSFAYLAPANILRAVAAQSTHPSGAYGFLSSVSQSDSCGGNGAALLRV